MINQYGPVTVLIGTLIFLCALIGLSILLWAGWVLALDLYDHLRNRWRRISHKPASRFYQPKGRL